MCVYSKSMILLCVHVSYANEPYVPSKVFFWEEPVRALSCVNQCGAHRRGDREMYTWFFYDRPHERLNQGPPDLQSQALTTTPRGNLSLTVQNSVKYEYKGNRIHASEKK